MIVTMRRGSYFICLMMAAALLFSACSKVPEEESLLFPSLTPYSSPMNDDQGTLELATVQPDPTPTKHLTITTISPIPILESTIVQPSPTLSKQSTMTTVSPVSGDIEKLQITSQGIAGVYWSADGQAIIYATWREQREVVEAWWKYELATGKQSLIQAPFNLDLGIWEQLEASFINEESIWFEGGISPSGTYIVYNRLPIDHTYTPMPNEIYIPPLEVWIANLDDGEARKLGRCYRVDQVFWLAQEQQIIFSCGYEGPLDISMVNVDGSNFINLSTVFGGLGLSHKMALSPDETKLAVPDALGTLRVATLDGSEIQVIAKWGYMPNWSIDSRRLYYQRFEEFGDPSVDICVYDLSAGTNKVLISAKYGIPLSTFAVSPQENAAVFVNRGLWLMTWSR